MKYFGFVLVSFFMLSTEAYAEDGPVIYKEKTEVDFEALDVEGQLRKPPGQIIMNRTKAMFNPLLPPRLHFNEEMMQSVNDVK